MTIRVQYSAQVRQAAGMSAENIDVPDGCTVPQLVLLLAGKHGEPLRSAVLDADGRPLTSNMVFVGDTMVRWDSARSLRDGDVVSIVSPISGG